MSYNLKKIMKRQKTIPERISLFAARSPDMAVLIAIVIFNITFFFVAAFIISNLAPSTLSNSGFWPSVFYTITMILDAGCISFVVEDVGQTSVAVIILCLVIVLIGMITFTGAVIGYITNYISLFIEQSNSGKRPLDLSNHMVILNWNSRAAEVINDLLYEDGGADVVVLVSKDRELIETEIHDRLLDTITTNNRELKQEARKIRHNFVTRWLYVHTHKMRNNVCVIVREGDVLSTVQLSNISVEKASSILILGRDYQSDYMKYSMEDHGEDQRRGNSNLIKTLMLVIELTRAETSADHQKIVVEIEDSWTHELVNKIIENKEKIEKCNIIPIPVNRFLGMLLSQIALVPQLNQIYSELFSNRGIYFTSNKWNGSFDDDEINRGFSEYMETHDAAIPLSVMKTKEGLKCYYLCEDKRSIHTLSDTPGKIQDISLNEDYWISKKNVIILGHNSSMKYIMDCFDAFRNEWNYPDEREILDIVIVDDQKSLDRYNSYKQYPYVSNVVTADIYDKNTVYNTIMEFYEKHTGDISIMILSDDQVPNAEVDEQSLTYLIYIDDMLQKQKKKNPDFDMSSCDIIVEILNPQNYEAVRSYNKNHVVITNQYISHMMTQISEHSSIYEFYRDILTYDSIENGSTKELYVKSVSNFFKEIPGKCSAHDLVRSVFEAGPKEDKSIIMGYIRNRSEYVLFVGNDRNIELELKEDDKLIICSNH